MPYKKKYTFSQILRLILYKTKNIKIPFIKSIRKKIEKYIGIDIETKEGDCVMFLANAYHAPIPQSGGPRKSLYLSYGTNNKHARNYNNYYLKHRAYPIPAETMLINDDIHEEFKNLLTDKNIYIKPSEKKEEIENVT